MPPGQEPYNIDALWAMIAAQLDDAKLVQLDRMRVGHQRLGLRELAGFFAMPAERSSRAWSGLDNLPAPGNAKLRTRLTRDLERE
jgi:hypothetical protein